MEVMGRVDESRGVEILLTLHIRDGELTMVARSSFAGVLTIGNEDTVEMATVDVSSFGGELTFGKEKAVSGLIGLATSLGVRSGEFAWRMVVADVVGGWK